MKKGLNYSLRVLFDTFLAGILFSVLSELVFLAIAKLLNFDIYLDTDVFMSVLVAIFLTFIFSGKNIINQLFINGFSRKKIANIKTLSCMIYSLTFFLLIFLFEIFYAKLFSNIMDLETIIRLVVIYLSICVSAELATFISLLYKNISMKKGKGVHKTFYRYMYSFGVILLTYIYRIVYPNVLEYYTIIVLAVIAVLFCCLQFYLARANRKWILNIDIRA